LGYDKGGRGVLKRWDTQEAIPLREKAWNDGGRTMPICSLGENVGDDSSSCKEGEECQEMKGKIKREGQLSTGTNGGGGELRWIMMGESKNLPAIVRMGHHRFLVGGEA